MTYRTPLGVSEYWVCIQIDWLYSSSSLEFNIVVTSNENIKLCRDIFLICWERSWSFLRLDVMLSSPLRHPSFEYSPTQVSWHLLWISTTLSMQLKAAHLSKHLEVRLKAACLSVSNSASEEFLYQKVKRIKACTSKQTMQKMSFKSVIIYNGFNANWRYTNMNAAMLIEQKVTNKHVKQMELTNALVSQLLSEHTHISRRLEFRDQFLAVFFLLLQTTFIKLWCD